MTVELYFDIAVFGQRDNYVPFIFCFSDLWFYVCMRWCFAKIVFSVLSAKLSPLLVNAVKMTVELYFVIAGIGQRNNYVPFIFCLSFVQRSLCCMRQCFTKIVFSIWKWICSVILFFFSHFTNLMTEGGFMF